MKRKIFLQILGATAVSLVLLFVAVIVITYANGRQMIRQRLKVETDLVTQLLNDESEFPAFQKYYNNDELRVTIISMDGEVKYESDDEASEENHLDREEVQAALNGTPKAVARYSETFACEMTYYAMKGALSDGSEVIVRLAVRSSEISSYLLPAMPFLILSLLITMGVASMFANKLSRGVSERINEVGDSLKSLNAGQYQPLKTDAKEPEFYSVFSEINELNESTHEHMRREESEHIKLNAVLDNVSQGIVALNKKREIEFVNDSALSIFAGKGLVAGRMLSYLIEDISFCEGCSLAHICGECRRVPAEIDLDEELDALINRKQELAAAKTEYDKLDREIKNKVGEREKVITGGYLIQRNKVERKGYTVPDSVYYKLNIKRL